MDLGAFFTLETFVAEYRVSNILNTFYVSYCIANFLGNQKLHVLMLTLISCIVALVLGSLSSILPSKCFKVREIRGLAGYTSGSFCTFRCNSAGELAVHGTRPVNIAYRVTPKDQISAGWIRKTCCINELLHLSLLL